MNIQKKKKLQDFETFIKNNKTIIKENLEKNNILHEASGEIKVGGRRINRKKNSKKKLIKNKRKTKRKKKTKNKLKYIRKTKGTLKRSQK